MKRCVILIFCTVLMFTSCTFVPSQKNDDTEKAVEVFNEENYEVKLNDNVRAMWITQYDITLMCIKNGAQRPIDEYRSRVSMMVATLLSLGINTVFIQARPNGDSLYDSDIFPPSAYASGKLGQDSAYDVFGILANEAIRAGISVHAWINPLRLMKISELSEIDEKYVIGRWKNDFLGTRISTVGEYCYLDPAYTEVRDLIVSGAIELMDRYDIDGIHIDDYFYPTTAKAFDAISYEIYGNGLSLADFRRKNINLLISELHAAASARELIFGVSPGGNMDRNYNELYADIEEWCEQGIVDYLCPQIYFGLLHETFPFEKTAREFSLMCAENGIDLIIGMTLEKAQNGYNGIGDVYAGSGKNEWIDNKDVLARCADVVFSLDCKGIAFFSYRLFYSPNDRSENEATKEERENLFKVIENKVA